MNFQYPSLFFDLSRELLLFFMNIGKKKNRLLKGSFYLLSVCFSFIVKIRNFLYNKKICKTKTVNKFVVSVGNIVVGGTGKTQVVCWLTNELSRFSLSLAVLYRGYKGKLSRHFFPVIVDPVFNSVEEVGDESFLCARKFPHIPVIVNKNRLKSAKIADQVGADILIMDDGFQYRKLDRDLNLLVVNAKDILGGNAFLPFGRLRDEPKRLAEADCIFVNGDYSREVENVLLQKSAAPRVYVKSGINEICFVGGKKISSLENISIGVFCGLGCPENFFDSLKDIGALVVSRYILPDHQAITLSELRLLSRQVINRGGQYLICTEKDFVKCSSLAEKEDLLPIGWAQVDLRVTYNRTCVDNLLDTIRKRNRRSFL